MFSWVPFLPDAASTFADRVDALYLYLVALTIFFSSGIALAIIYFAVRYRRRSPDEIPRPIAGSLKLELLWTVIPFLISMTIFVWGASVYFSLYRAPANAIDIYVVGKQWMWKFQHVDGQREINELHVPVGSRVRLTMTTEDVIHSFYVPAFRIKMDVVPGRYSTTWFEATQTGRFHLFCAEFCGTNHSGMGGYVVVMEPSEYQDWLSGGATDSPASQGQRLFQDLGCVTCHRQDSQGRGPMLTNVFGNRVELDNGETIVADENYLRESVRNPQARIVAGFARPSIMPMYTNSQITEEQLLQLIAYIRSLGAQTAPQGGRNTATGAGGGSVETTTGRGVAEPQTSNPLLTPNAPTRTGGTNNNSKGNAGGAVNSNQRPSRSP